MANFAGRLVHGPGWDPSRPIRDQDGWELQDERRARQLAAAEMHDGPVDPAHGLQAHVRQVLLDVQVVTQILAGPPPTAGG